MGKQIEESILAILSRVTVEGEVIFLTCGQLDRKQYQAVNDVLTNMGGKWNKSKKGHIFPDDPTDKLEQVLLTGEITLPKKYGYFPTPPELAKRVIELAEMGASFVLEPSAGQGGLADFVPDDCVVTCYELLDDNISVLKTKGHIVKQRDFISVEPDCVYDRVIMNPPFERQQDIDHVLHAWKFLKDGGRLVSIMSASVMFRENRKTTEFREFVELHGYIERLPDESFKTSGTMVSTCVIVLDKPSLT